MTKVSKIKMNTNNKSSGIRNTRIWSIHASACLKMLSPNQIWVLINHQYLLNGLTRDSNFLNVGRHEWKEQTESISLKQVSFGTPLTNQAHVFSNHQYLLNELKYDFDFLHVDEHERKEQTEPINFGGRMLGHGWKYSWPIRFDYYLILSISLNDWHLILTFLM